MKAYKITVIVPVFKVEPFIVRCAEMLFEQTFQEVQYVFVNDCSPDRSITLLEETLCRYPERKQDVEIVHHDKNKGLAATRNTGLRLAKGEYILHCDSDDFLEKDALENFWMIVENTQADIVWSDWFLTYVQSERQMSEPTYKTPIEALRSLLGGGMKFNVWNKLVRRALYTQHDIQFPEGHNMGEDMTMIMLFALAHSVAHVAKPLYHYVRLNENAYTNQRTTQQQEDILFNAQRVIDFLYLQCPNEISDADIAKFLLNVKFPLLISERTNDYITWQQWFSQANAYIWSNRSMGFRARFIQWCASKKLYIIVKLHAKALRIYYSKVYK